MNKETLNKIKNAKENPIFKGLSDEIKDPKNFVKTENKIRRTMISDHKHATIKQFMKCQRCQIKMQKKREMLKELGFKNFIQYQNWKKIMVIILNKQDLRLYEQ